MSKSSQMEADVTENEKGKEPKITQGRSPAYPYISLDKAFERMSKVSQAGIGRHPYPPETFYSLWGLGTQSSGARQTITALNHFGLVKYVGRGKDRKVKLSDLALKICLDQVQGSESRKKAIQQAALEPAIHHDLWEKYGPILPHDTVLKTYLTLERDYNVEAANSLIAEYKATLEFSGLTEIDSWSTNLEDDLPNPQSSEKAHQASAASGYQAQPETGRHEERPEGSMYQSVPASYRKAVFPLDEGDVTIIFPQDLSTDALVELGDYLQIFLKKEKRKKDEAT
jgi:hypothetical protein